jgi:non-homologous end joining protein Ku
MAMIEEKVKGREITVAPQSPAPRVVIDLMAALKESMKTAQRGKNRREKTQKGVIAVCFTNSLVQTTGDPR